MKDEKPEQSSWGFDELYLSSPCFFGRAANRFLANNLAHVPVGKALDLGCGEGTCCTWPGMVSRSRAWSGGRLLRSLAPTRKHGA